MSEISLRERLTRVVDDMASLDTPSMASATRRLIEGQAMPTVPSIPRAPNNDTPSDEFFSALINSVPQGKLIRENLPAVVPGRMAEHYYQKYRELPKVSTKPSLEEIVNISYSNINPNGKNSGYFFQNKV